MNHLRALCDVLETTIDEMTSDKPAEAVTAIETAVLRGLRKIEPVQAETILALIQSMTK